MPAKTDQLAPRRRPSQDRSRDRVERILDATSALLVGTPIDKITTAAIAEEAGVPIGSVYQYFPNKLAVLAELARRVMEEVIRPTIEGMAADGAPFTGFLYAGLMIDGDQPSVVEFNCRFGDPETQAVLARWEGDMLPAINAVISGENP